MYIIFYKYTVRKNITFSKEKASLILVKENNASFNEMGKNFKLQKWNNIFVIDEDDDNWVLFTTILISFCAKSLETWQKLMFCSL